jgi:hypothetical protein
MQIEKEKYYRLRVDVYSSVKKGMLYGSKMDKVKVIELYTNVAIVELNGKKFSVFNDDLME